MFDDLRLIPNNPQIRLIEINWDNIRQVVSSSRPVAMFSFALNYYFDGYNVAGYHATNIVIHLLAGFFLYLFVRKTLGLQVPSGGQYDKFFLPLVAVSLWLVHPVQTQSVSYIIQRMNSMAAMFYILAMLCYVTARMAEGRAGRWLLFACCGAAGVLALGSKEIAATLPGVVILYEWYFFQDLSRRWIWRAGLALLLVILCVVALIYFYPQFVPMGIIHKGFAPYDFTMGQRVLTELRVVMFLYTGLLLYPHPDRLNLDYDYPLSTSFVDPPATIFALLALLALVWFAVSRARKDRLLSFCILWFLGNLLIESSVIPLDLVFEHRLYLPSMLGIFAVVLIVARGVTDKRVRGILAITIFCVFAAWTGQRNMVWGDSMALFVDCAEKSPGKPRPAYNVACEYAKRGNAAEAVQWLERTVGLQGFDHWDLLKYDKDLDPIRGSEVFRRFFEKYVPLAHKAVGS